MKSILAVLILFSPTFVFSQNYKIGVEIAPSYRLQTFKNKSTTLRSSKSGYGFSAGLPVKFELSGSNTLSTGILYDYTAFDTKFNNTLVSSLRTSAIQIPIEFNQIIMDNWYANFGTGFSYNFIARQNNFGFNNNITSLTNNFQPFLSFGISTILDRGGSDFDLGVNAKYYILDFWKNADQTSTHNIYIDLQMKYFF